MEILEIKGNWKSPSVLFNPDGNLQMWGRSLPENALEIYNPIFNWLDNYISSPSDQTTVEVKLEYFNTTSSKLIYEMFKRFEEINSNGNKINVKWYYESDDPDLEEEGKLLAKIIKLDIELIPVDEFDFVY
jgi:hypothetical protein